MGTDTRREMQRNGEFHLAIHDMGTHTRMEMQGNGEFHLAINDMGTYTRSVFVPFIQHAYEGY